MAQLKKDVKLFIVRALAVFNTPTQVAVLVNEEYALTVTKQQCERYDPTKRAGQDLSSELKAEFEAARKAFLNTPQNIPIANLSVRLQHYQHILERVGKNNVLAMKVLEQAAKDVGGQFTNKTELTGAGGGPIQQENTTTVIATPDQIRDTMRKLDDTY